MRIVKIEKNGCVPCNILSNMIYDLAPELTELGVSVKTVNISDNPEAIEEYGISSVPVLIFDCNGVELTRNGLLSRDEFLSEVQSMVKSYE